MANHPYISTKRVFMDTIGFLKYAELDEESLRDLGVSMLGVERVFLSPDVHSLDIVWVNADGSVQAEIADYPYQEDEVSLTDFLSTEIGDDSYEMWEAGEVRDVFRDVLSDMATWTPENTPKISLKALQEAEAKELESDQARTVKLFSMLGFPKASDDE